VAVNPFLDNQLYPSLILATTSSNTFNFQLAAFTVEVTAPTDNAVLRVVIDSSALNYVTIVQEILPRRGETYRFQPAVKWKYDVLRALRQPGAVDLTFTCFVNDEEVPAAAVATRTVMHGDKVNLSARPVHQKG
jgi:hypothetical protein